MQHQPSSRTYSTSRITPKAPWRLVKVCPLADYALDVEFTDGTMGKVMMQKLVMGDNAGVFETLRDLSVFKQVFLLHGTATWPGGIDAAPDAMYDAIKAYGVCVLG